MTVASVEVMISIRMTVVFVAVTVHPVLIVLARLTVTLLQMPVEFVTVTDLRVKNHIG